MSYKSTTERMLEAQKSDDIIRNYQLQKDIIKQSYFKKQKIEKLKKEITADVLSQIGTKLEDEALKKLIDMINKLGKWKEKQYAIYISTLENSNN